LVKAPIATSPFYKIRSPEEVVASLDEEDMLGKYGRFFTMVYAIVNAETGGVSYYRAGHNYPLLIKNNSHSYYIEGGGPPIGLGMSLSKKQEQSIRLGPGDQLVFFSDGINETFSPKSGERYGLERAKNLLTDHYSEPLKKSFNRLIADAQDFMGLDDFSDDISIVGIKWLGGEVN
jgi:sigma-B regulation protein RsbU (phosphoserine phosphatase)